MRGFPQLFIPTSGTAAAADDHDLYIRVANEYRELPGLALTVRQAARLFCVEPSRCEHVLEALVFDGLLFADGKTYARRDHAA